MAVNILQCGSSISNMTLFQCAARYGMPNTVWLSLEEKLGITFANALLTATWLTEENKTVGTRNFILKRANDAFPTVGDALFKSGNLTPEDLVRKGIPMLELHYHNQRDCEIALLKSFNGQRMYAYIITENGALIGTDDGVNFINIPVDVYVSEVIWPENKDEPWVQKVWLKFPNAEGNFTKFVLPNDSDYNSGSLWKPSSRNGIVDVTMTQDSVAATTVTVSILGTCDEREIDEPLVTDDFKVTKTSDGSTVSVTVTNPNSDNVYIIADLTTATQYDITLKNQPGMTTKGYESQSILQSTTS